MPRVLLTLLVLAFTVYCLVSIAQAGEGGVRNLPRWAWILLVLFFPVAGGIAYVLAGRPLPQAPGYGRGSLGGYRGGPGGGRGRGPVRGPDDDEDFLRGL